jgi:tRNA A-37 threonylcarbamoyl transferase component Bud32/DNA-binding response OmpR family regulator
MRLLYIEDDPKSRARIRHHLSCRWPDVELTAWAPVQRGALPPEFLAQGYDAVLLAQSWPGGDGLDWLRDLATRPGFAPVIFLADRDSAQVREAAEAWSAFAVLAKERIAHEALLEAVERAGQQHRRQLADWRVSPAAEETRRFGDARIPGYRRARLLARGSVSQLYIAESEKAGALVVLKVTPSQRNASGIDQVFDRFLQEYEITTKVRHPNVVRLYELGVADDHAYLAMEYFPLGDLRRRMRGGLSPAEALGIAAQIARVLAAIHAAGVLHRDLKPGNVMMRTENQVALIDFGLAKHLALDLELTDTGLIFGTPHYMSPEQGHGQALDARSDLYSLGIVLFEMLTGAKPYTADNPMAVLYMHRNAPLPLLPDSLASLQPLLDTLLAKLPAERITDAVGAARRIEAARSEWLARLAHA